MSDLIWLSEAQMRRIEAHFPLSHGVPRVDDRRVISGIIFVIRNGLRWRGAQGLAGFSPSGSNATARNQTLEPALHIAPGFAGTTAACQGAAKCRSNVRMSGRGPMAALDSSRPTNG